MILRFFFLCSLASVAHFVLDFIFSLCFCFFFIPCRPITDFTVFKIDCFVNFHRFRLDLDFVLFCFFGRFIRPFVQLTQITKLAVFFCVLLYDRMVVHWPSSIHDKRLALAKNYLNFPC